LLGVGEVAGGTPALLLLPRLSEEPGPSALVRLEPEEAARRLPNALLGAGSWKKTSDLFQAPTDAPPPTEAALAELCRRTVERLECYECVLAVRERDEDRLAAAIIDLL